MEGDELKSSTAKRTPATDHPADIDPEDTLDDAIRISPSPEELLASESSANRCQALLSVRQTVIEVLQNVRHRFDVMYLQGSLPGAVEVHVSIVQRGFQRKALGILFFQAVMSLVVASVVAKLDDLKPAPQGQFIFFCAFTPVGVKFCSLLRFRFPWNYVAVATLSVFAGATLGLSTRYLLGAYEWIFQEQPALQLPQLLFLGAYVVALLIMLLLIAVASRRRTMRMMVASCIATAITDTLLVVIWANTSLCRFGWLCGIIIVLTASVLWTGYDMDRLLRKLMVDEYLLPATVVWGDFCFFVILGGGALLIYTLIMADKGGSESGLLEGGPGKASHDLDCCRCSCADCVYFADPQQPQGDAAAQEPTPVVPQQARMAWTEES